MVFNLKILTSSILLTNKSKYLPDIYLFDYLLNMCGIVMVIISINSIY